MNLSKLCLLVILTLLAGCYRAGPGDGEISTVPVTNNPHQMPGSMKTNPMPNVF